MRIQKKSRVLALILALLMLLCACGGNTQPPTSSVTEPNTPADTDAPPVSAPVEEPSDVPPSEEPPAPSEETPAPSEEIPRFYEVNGLSYPSALGKPVLGESAAALVSSVSLDEASEQITNVGDAIWYLQSAEKFDQPYDTCNLFATLIAGDYDEVGFIRLTCPGNGDSLVYVLQNGIYYPFNPFALARGYSGWFCGHGSACTEGEDLDAICEEVMATWPDGGADQSKRSYSVEKRSSRDTEPSEEAPTPSDEPPTPSEEVPAPSEETPRFYEVNGLSYPSALGKPVLGENAADLVSSVSQSEASKQITNVGDAIRYLQSAGEFDDPSDACYLFASLIARDYDEVGFIMLRCSGNGGRLAYILQDGMYYLLDPGALAAGYPGWFCGHGRACVEGEDLDAICEEVMATWPVGGADQSKRSYSVEKHYSCLTEQEEELFTYLTTPQYTRDQIDQWAAEGLPLSQWAEKIKVPADAIQMLEALGYRSMLYQDNMCFFGPNGTEWGGMWNAQTVFTHRSGNCGGTSHIMNFLLSGDFDEQGYVEYNTYYGGHIFNYFLSDGIYVMCDFVSLFAEERVYIDEGTDAYVVFIGADLHKFKEEYMTIKGHNDPEGTEYILQLFMHSWEGASLPKGQDQNSYHYMSFVVWDLLPQQYQDSYTILFEREGYPIRFLPISDPDTWPAAIRAEQNAPADTAESSHFYTVPGVFYPSELGEPVLGEDAAALVSSVSLSAAAEQITNVGDAIWYMQSVGKFDDPFDASNLFATLIAGDYDEVGFIHLTCPGNGCRLAYILQDGIYYPFDPFALAEGYCSWFYGGTKGENLDAICEEVMATWPDGGADQSKRSYSIERRYFRITE